MSEYYDHRWEPLAEFHFNLNTDYDPNLTHIEDDDNYIYCLCSRAFIRDSMKTYVVEKGDGSESDVEVVHKTKSSELDDQSHVHFSLDVSHKIKYEKDENASCYCSASHTENYCSTDEQDLVQNHGTISNALQPSDSGADLTYPDCLSDYIQDKSQKGIQDFPHERVTEFSEDYLSEDTWEKFWAINSERLIWASWIKNYSNYINPGYLDENNELLMDENNAPKQHLSDTVLDKEQPGEKNVDEKETLRERKFSYDSKVNPYKKITTQLSANNNASNELTCNKDEWVPIGRRRSCSEHDRMLSPKNLETIDSMTNVTKITISSYDVTSSHVTSSTPTDDYSVSSSTSDDHTQDQTKIVNLDDNSDQLPLEEMDPEYYWQFLWKKHFGEQYALHYANFIESHIINKKISDIPEINVEIASDKIVNERFDIECENSEGNSQETPTVIEVENKKEVSVKEVQTQVNEINLEEKVNKSKKRSKKPSNRYIDSVGVLLQNLLKDEKNKSETNEVLETGEGTKNKTTNVTNITPNTTTEASVVQDLSYNNNSPCNVNDGDDDPPEQKSFILKRSHEIDDDDDEETSERIKSTFQIMGFCLGPKNMPKGEIVYRKRLARLRPPRHKRYGISRKTYFDDDGNPYQPEEESQDDREAQTDEDLSEVQCIDVKVTDIVGMAVPETSITEYDVTSKDLSDNDRSRSIVLEAATVPLPSDVDTSFSDTQENIEDPKEPNLRLSTKRRRRQKRHFRGDVLDDTEVSDMPEELKSDPKMVKYWKRRHSLFHRFDEGVRLDRESWFSVTPENVARHIATKCTYDVVLDAFCGAGGNTIQFAKVSKKVIAIDIDPVKIEMARHNAAVYGVSDYIEFIVGDFFELASDLKADMVFLSPPWGGPKYSQNDVYDLESMLEPKPASELMAVARTISYNVTLYLPRNTKTDQILSLAQESGGSIEIEQNYLDRRFVAITAYFY